MDEQPKPRGGPLYWLKRRSRRFWLIATALLPVFYVASFGPVCWCAARQPLLTVPAAYAYWPLTKAARAAHVRSRLHAYGDMGARGDADLDIITKIVRFDF